MQQHILKHEDGTVSVCSEPFQEHVVETGARVASRPMDISPEDMEKVLDPTLNTELDSKGRLKFTENEEVIANLEAEEAAKVRRDELRQKAVEGTLKSEEILEALKFLL